MFHAKTINFNLRLILVICAGRVEKVRKGETRRDQVRLTRYFIGFGRRPGRKRASDRAKSHFEKIDPAKGPKPPEISNC